MENSNNKKNNFLDSLKEIFHYFEYYIVDSNTVLHAPLWGRVLLIIPFIEDALSIFLNWNEQVNYYGNTNLVEIFLLINALGLFIGSLATFHKMTIKFGVYGLIGIELLQLTIFKQLFNLSFYFKLLCNINGLLLILAEAFITQSSEINKLLLFEQPKILNNVDINIQKNIKLLEKCVIILNTLSIFLSNRFNIFIAIAAAFSIIALGLIFLGAKNECSITYFIFYLSILNLAINNYWTLNETMYLTKFQISQALTILSGITLLTFKVKKN